MIYAQIKAGQKLHLAYEAGEGKDENNIIKAGFLSGPICGKKMSETGYRMNINVPLGSACKNCLRVARVRASRLA